MANGYESVALGETVQEDVLHAELVHLAARGRARMVTWAPEGEESNVQDLAAIVREDPDRTTAHLAVIFDRPETPEDETAIIAVYPPDWRQQEQLGYKTDSHLETTEGEGVWHITATNYEDALVQFRRELFANDNDRPDEMDTPDHAAKLASRLVEALQAEREKEAALEEARRVALGGLRQAVAAIRASRSGAQVPAAASNEHVSGYTSTSTAHTPVEYAHDPASAGEADSADDATSTARQLSAIFVGADNIRALTTGHTPADELEEPAED